MTFDPKAIRERNNRGYIREYLSDVISLGSEMLRTEQASLVLSAARRDRVVAALMDLETVLKELD